LIFGCGSAAASPIQVQCSPNVDGERRDTPNSPRHAELAADDNIAGEGRVALDGIYDRQRFDRCQLWSRLQSLPFV
jgi:hypothetical protein